MNWFQKLFGSNIQDQGISKLYKTYSKVPTSKFILDLKSTDPLVRKVAAEAFSYRFDNKAIAPLFQALMNWNEEEDIVKLISVALFINLWEQIPKEYKTILIKTLQDELEKNGQVDMFHSGVCGAMVGLLINQVLDGKRPNPGQSERISTMVRNSMNTKKGRNIVLFGEESISWSYES